MNLKFLLFSWLIKINLACNGYKAKLVSIGTCGEPNEIITIEKGFNIELNKNCEIVPTGCVSYKGFKTAKGKFTISKDGDLLKDGELDLCKAAEAVALNPEEHNFMKLFALPNQCPVEDGKFCASENTKADISIYKQMLSVAKGNIFINSTITHDTGISCLNIHAEVSK